MPIFAALEEFPKRGSSEEVFFLDANIFFLSTHLHQKTKFIPKWNFIGVIMEKKEKKFELKK